MLSASWRTKRTLIWLVLVSLIIILIRGPGTGLYSATSLRIRRLRASQRAKESFLPPIPEGCPAESTDGTHNDTVIPCWPGDIPYDILSQVQVVMKTGSAEKEKTAAFLDTFGSCIPDVLILSDANYTIGHHHVIDILAELPDTYAHDNADWSVYLEQHRILASGQQPPRTTEGWKLDRFKFLPMVEKAYEVAPHAKWYVFIEADIYYFWDTLFRLLNTLDSREALYLGSAVPGSYGRWFAYGGSGAVLSHKLVHNLLHDGKRKVSAMPVYEEWTKNDCCGDAVLAYVIHEELGVRLQSLAPTFSNEEPPWLTIDRTNWCTPLLGLHRVVPEMMRKLWQWERCRPPTDTPVTYAAMLDFLLTPMQTHHRAKWNNGADDVLPMESDAHSSLDACQTACTASATCLQHSYSQNICRHASFVKSGAADDEVTSGWDILSLRGLGYSPFGDPAYFCAKAEWPVPLNPDAKVT